MDTHKHTHTKKTHGKLLDNALKMAQLFYLRNMNDSWIESTFNNWQTVELRKLNRKQRNIFRTYHVQVDFTVEHTAPNVYPSSKSMPLLCSHPTMNEWNRYFNRTTTSSLCFIRIIFKICLDVIAERRWN